jgi:serine/threonine-protein kinase
METGPDADFCPFCGIPQKKSLENPESLGSEPAASDPATESVASASADAPGAVATESSESPESHEPAASDPGTESVAPASADAPEPISSADDDDEDKPTILYTSQEFERLTTGDVSGGEVNGESKDENAEPPVVEAKTTGEISDPLDPIDSPDSIGSSEVIQSLGSIDTIEDVSNDLPSAPDWLKDESKAVSSNLVVPEKPEDTGSEQPFTSQIEEADTAGRKRSKQAHVLTEGALLNTRYEIVRKIGGGGMGAVYLASDRNLGGVLRAVKEMVQSHIEPEQQEKALQDFKRESMLLTSLEHPCIPTIYDYFYDETAGRFYLVMKYISGGDLAARLRSTPEGKVDEKSVTEWAAQTADVLDYLHSRQPPIVYRDLKPSNLMIDGNTGRIMVVDFGIARWVTKDEKGVTAVGTMGYAPPELFSGNVEPRSDLYSLGATMFHLLTGADPQSNPLLIFDFSKNPRPRHVNPNVSNEMEQILMRAVEYNVELRYGSAAEMREALITHLERVRYGQLTYGPPQAMAPSSSGMASGQNLVFCGFCGEKIFVSDVFCPYCGAKQAVADPQQSGRQPVPFVQQMPPQVSAQTLARVTVLGTGELNPPTYRLEKLSNVVGRRDPQTNIFPEVDLSKYDPQTKISRRHARIWKDGANFMVEDLGSSNGTVVVSSMNEAIRLLPHQPQILVHNSKLVVGDTTLQFVVG